MRQLKEVFIGFCFLFMACSAFANIEQESKYKGAQAPMTASSSYLLKGFAYSSLTLSAAAIGGATRCLLAKNPHFSPAAIVIIASVLAGTMGPAVSSSYLQLNGKGVVLLGAGGGALGALALSPTVMAQIADLPTLALYALASFSYKVRHRIL